MTNLPNQVSIEQLKDIALPAEPGLWPLAIGWWLLIAVSLIILFVAARQLTRYIKRWSIKRLALNKLDQCTSCDEINQLLKQVAIHYCGQRVSSLNGQAWTDFLSLNMNEATKLALKDIHNALYTAHHVQYFEQFKPIANQWLSKLNTRALLEMKNADF